MSDSESPATARIESLERLLQRDKTRRDAWTVSIFVFSAAALLTSLVGVGFGLRSINEAKLAAGGGDSGVLEADLSEFAIELSADSVEVDGTVAVHNAGSALHNLAIRETELASPDLAAGESARLDLAGLEAGTYELFCEVAGHAEAGMTAELTVGDSTNARGGEKAVHADHDQTMVDSILAFPADTKGRGNQPLQPTLLGDGTKRFELTASVVDWEVSPGTVVKAWAYNGMVPGPRIDLDLGDRVEVELTNALSLGTDIHWHGIDVPNDQDGVSPITQKLVKPGQSHLYRFTATEPAIGMYHAHAHAYKAVPNGLFGTIYVGDLPLPAGRTVSGIPIPAGLALSQDLPMVLNDAGVIGLSLDGKSFPATAPVVASAGDWIRVTYFNEGLQVHPMHLHGFEQIVIAKDGEPLDQPYAADTVLVGPGERYTVLFNASAPGTWVWHCHILNHAESEDGMFGMVTAVVVGE